MKVIDMQLPSGATALNVACEHGRFDVVVALVNAGADLELADSEGYTPLITAAQLGYSDIIQLLVNRGADVNVQLPSGGTALLTAVWHRRLAVVRILLDNGADIDLCGDFQNWPPLTAAYFSGFSDLVQLIYERVPDDTDYSTEGRAPIAPPREISATNNSVDQKYRNGDTALRIACERGLSSVCW
ncbi:hypothetical protein PR001_g22194 [Phytophthora rubi]|uniref:Uncharacterized protein n=1 Tax=Phytophthora rubi TaxID=129364 RepID=A0A6A3J104_9STRA|nr:hypothetical protein PR001_g22194 [Phytophthora rubi]